MSIVPESTLSQSAFETMRGWIVSGELAAGSVVSERRIAERLGLSRTPIREALGRLEGEGHLRRDGRTIIVNAIDSREIMEILALRVLLEAEAARLAARRASVSKVKAIRTAVKAMRQEKVTPEQHWLVDDQLHNGIAEASGNRTLQRLVADLGDRTRMFGIDKIPARFAPGQTEHLAILDALEKQDPDAAAAQMELHLQNVRKAILSSFSLDE